VLEDLAFSASHAKRLGHKDDAVAGRRGGDVGD
jgi:hypothetical protein